MTNQQITANTEWKTSSYSMNGNTCVEHRQLNDPLYVQLRDTKFREYGVIGFKPEVWQEFVSSIGAIGIGEVLIQDV